MNAIVTGSASGIGRRLTGALARQGHRVVATDIDGDALASAARGDGWPAEQVATALLDVRDPSAWEAVFDQALSRFGQIDLLLNVAGVIRAGWVHEQAAGDAALHLDVNAKGVILGTQTAARIMVRQGSGHIVNIASMAGIAPVPGISLYTASKFAVRGFSLAVAQELRPHGVAVTVICPDAVDTPMYERQIARPEAALTFSGPGPLDVTDIERVLLRRVLPRRPVEVVLPRWRGWISKTASALPLLAFHIGPLFAQRGRKVQERLKVDRG